MSINNKKYQINTTSQDIMADKLGKSIIRLY